MDLPHYSFNYLVKMVPAAFFHCKVTILPFINGKYLVRRYFKTM